MASLVNATKHLKNYLLKLFQTHFMRPALLWYQNQTRKLQKRKLQASISEHSCKSPQQNICGVYLVYIHIQKKAILLFATTWMDLKGIMLNEMRDR